MLVLLGYFLAIVMGVTLGTIGAGGSILTVPILVYFFGIKPVLATSYSLFFVGTTALIGSYKYYQSKQIDLLITAAFALPSLLAVYATRRWLLPTLPDTIWQIQGYVISKDQFIMLLFVALMMLSSVFMMRKKPTHSKTSNLNALQKSSLIILEGTIVGILTGLIGAGGGFLIIPALVLLVGLDIKVAIGSSLLIIACKSLVGFWGDIQTGIEMDYFFLGTFLIFTSIGLFVGTRLTNYLSAERLKVIFGLFTLIIAIAILIVEI